MTQRDAERGEEGERKRGGSHMSSGQLLGCSSLRPEVRTESMSSGGISS